MNIPIVFFLALISVGGYNRGTVTIHDIPFSTYDDCIIAGNQIAEEGFSYFRCFQQRQNDVKVFQNWNSFGGSEYDR